MITDEIKNIIDQAVSDYADSHWHHDDFDSARQRIKYLEEIADGNGWNDDAADGVIEILDSEDWEDENGNPVEVDTTDQDVLDYIYNAICEEAENWLEWE